MVSYLDMEARQSFDVPDRTMGVCDEDPATMMHPRILILALTLAALTFAACDVEHDTTYQQLTLSVFASDRSAGEVLLVWEGGPGRQANW